MNISVKGSISHTNYVKMKMVSHTYGFTTPNTAYYIVSLD